MNIHGIELDERYAPFSNVIDEYLSLSPNEATDWAEDLAGLAADDMYNEEQGLPRENGNAIERLEVLTKYFRSKGIK